VKSLREKEVRGRRKANSDHGGEDITTKASGFETLRGEGRPGIVGSCDLDTAYR